ncbi:MAG: DUF4097 domain-containing protein [Acholeplasmataceae bacterium]|nr:DUF4097 domain-containing protein [Acholeplasmataceae bacterium]
MKFLIKLVLLIFFVGLILTAVAFFGGVNLGNIGDYFVDDEDYGDPIEFVMSDPIDTLDVDLDNRNIVVTITTGDDIIVTYHEHEKDTWSLSETGGTFTITQETKPVFFNWFNFKMASYEVMTVYIEIPEDLVLDYSLSSDVGDIVYIEAPELTHDFYANSNTGDVRIENAEIDQLIVRVNTGSINLSDLVINGDVDAKTDTGTIELTNLSTDELLLDTDTGRVELNQVSANQVDAQSDTGRIEMNDSTILGLVELSTSTGNVTVTDSVATGFDLSSSTGSVRFTSATHMDLRYDLDTSVGNILVNGDDQGTKHSTSTGTILLKVRVSTGNITVSVQD